MKRDLPKRLHFKDGGYYRIVKNHWTFLGNHRQAALRRHIRLEHGLSEEGPVPYWTSLPKCLATRYRSAKASARTRGIEFTLTSGEFAELVERAKGRCEVSGIVFDLEVVIGSNRRPWAPSIDRIRSAGIYSFDNCRLVCCVVNWSMSDWGEGVFWQMVKQARRIRGRGNSSEALEAA